MPHLLSPRARLNRLQHVNVVLQLRKNGQWPGHRCDRRWVCETKSRLCSQRWWQRQQCIKYRGPITTRMSHPGPVTCSGNGTGGIHTVVPPVYDDVRQQWLHSRPDSVRSQSTHPWIEGIIWPAAPLHTPPEFSPFHGCTSHGTGSPVRALDIGSPWCLCSPRCQVPKLAGSVSQPPGWLPAASRPPVTFPRTGHFPAVFRPRTTSHKPDNQQLCSGPRRQTTMPQGWHGRCWHEPVDHRQRSGLRWQTAIPRGRRGLCYHEPVDYRPRPDTGNCLSRLGYGGFGFSNVNQSYNGITGCAPESGSGLREFAVSATHLRAVSVWPHPGTQIGLNRFVCPGSHFYHSSSTPMAPVMIGLSSSIWLVPRGGRKSTSVSSTPSSSSDCSRLIFRLLFLTLRSTTTTSVGSPPLPSKEYPR